MSSKPARQRQDGEAYQNVVRGRLPMKGGIKKKRKKKKKTQLGDEFKDRLVATTGISDPVEQAELEKRLKDLEAQQQEEVKDTRTKAEIEFERVQRKRELELISKRIKKTHRNRIEEFNKFLGDLSEHHDIPRVTPGPR